MPHQRQRHPASKVRPYHGNSPRSANTVLTRFLAQSDYSSNFHSLLAQQDTARAVIEAYNAWNIDDIMAYRSPDCKHRVLPASMNRTAKTNAEYRAYLSEIMHLYSNFTVSAPRSLDRDMTDRCRSRWKRKSMTLQSTLVSYTRGAQRVRQLGRMGTSTR